MSHPVELSEANGVLTITLNRPKANAINVATSWALYQAFLKLQNEDHLRVGIITGTGRFFSAGWDLQSATEGEEITADHGPGGFAGLTEFFDLKKPVIAAVNGMAMGGGFELALAADVMICAKEAVFALPEVQLGMMADAGGILRLPQRMPHAIAKELLLTGRRMGAEEALRWGIANQIVEQQELLSAATAMAQQMVACAPLALAAVKEVLHHTNAMSIEQGYQRLRSGQLKAYNTMLHSEDAVEGPLAFSEKRKPVWKSR